ncbi:MAG: electron transport complex subunit RsxC [Candidatus Aureabacteria bacterium]|nr:electron transport complex subunit RsxC [Candidatus Auribacterota bacterium]
MIRALTFRGGVTVPEHKERTEGKAIETLPLPPRLFVPLRQNAGVPPEPVVEAGRAVLAGEVIARPAGPVSAFLHAPVAGTVKGIEKHSHPALPDSPAIEIETAPEQPPMVLLPPIPEPDRASPEEIRRRVLEAGIVGMGGAGFPTQVKLAPPPGARIEYAIINGAECEPFLTVDHRLMLEETEKVIRGLKIVMRAVGAEKGIIAVESNKLDAWEKLRASLAGEKSIRAELLQVKYPQGGEKQIIYSLLRRKVPAGGLPSAVGCVVQNVHTAVAIAEALVEGKPLLERVVTVSGPGVARPGNFRVRIGTPFAHLLAAAGGLAGGELMVISGGPMMGVAQFSLATPVIKGTSGLLVFPAAPRRRNLPCIRCGRCIRVCSLNLLPCRLARSAEKGNSGDFEEGSGAQCIECGCCAYVCPAGRDLVQFIQLGKAASAKKTPAAGK